MVVGPELISDEENFKIRQMRRPTDWQTGTNVSETPAANIFKVKELSSGM
jgi:hypothetical protein